MVEIYQNIFSLVKKERKEKGVREGRKDGRGRERGS